MFRHVHDLCVIAQQLKKTIDMRVVINGTSARIRVLLGICVGLVNVGT